jgi:hypothetical protein
LDLYRSAEVADQFAEGVRATVAQGKPVAITEFGSAKFHGAGNRGARGLEIVESDKETRAPTRLDGEYRRHEDGQAAYLRELLEVFDAEHVDSTSCSSSRSRPPAPTRQRPPRRLGLGRLRHREGLRRPPGKHLPGDAVGPKAAFATVGEYYRDH